MNSNSPALRLATASALDDIVREGARRMLQQAIEQEVADYIERHRDCRDDSGRRLVVRNGHKPPRAIATPAGPLQVRQPRVDDRRTGADGERMRFTSAILPPYLRRSRKREDLVPWLYLKGVSTGGFPEALGCLGLDGSGFSPASVVRMKEVWQQEWDQWNRRPLEGKRSVYVWADGIYCDLRLEEGRPCVLVLMGAPADGTKELMAVLDGERESEQSWRELLLDLKSRGLNEPPRLAVGDGALGFWKAMAQVFPSTRQQRCWVHKTANVLNRLPKSQQPAAKAKLHEIRMAATRGDATKAFDLFVRTYEAKYPKAAECLSKDRAEMLAFYDFPAEHWRHLRTTNPIESTFATVRLRTCRTKGPGSRAAGLAMAFKLALKAESRWRRLNGSAKLQDLIDGVVFVDGDRKAA